MIYDYGGPEPLHALANLRLSQSKPEEAVQSAQEAFQRLGLCGGLAISSPCDAFDGPRSLTGVLDDRLLWCV